MTSDEEREHCLFVAQELAEVHDMYQYATDEIADALFDERAAAFKDGEKAGYERGQVEQEDAKSKAWLEGYFDCVNDIETTTEKSFKALKVEFAEFKRLADHVHMEHSVRYDALQSKYETLAAAARAEVARLYDRARFYERNPQVSATYSECASSLRVVLETLSAANAPESVNWRERYEELEQAAHDAYHALEIDNLYAQRLAAVMRRHSAALSAAAKPESSNESEDK
jgi:hypothetical protein